ncbi:bifunctional DNA primase/polymerase [Microbacterium nanhaiense]|uniref:bifunctional DNA primase/polymerase n=1 Tax=Microbacterium nanhaiense TaxID=1301026 RepID=UPI0035715549
MPEPFDVLAALIRVDRSPNLALAARSLAAAGVPVFPCLVEGKRPLTRRGFLDASNDPEQVAAWWSRTPNANIGIPTGAASGVVVVDVDVHGPTMAARRTSAPPTRGSSMARGCWCAHPPVARACTSRRHQAASSVRGRQPRRVSISGATAATSSLLLPGESSTAM